MKKSLYPPIRILKKNIHRVFFSIQGALPIEGALKRLIYQNYIAKFISDIKIIH